MGTRPALAMSGMRWRFFSCLSTTVSLQIEGLSSIWSWGRFELRSLQIGGLSAIWSVGCVALSSLQIVGVSPISISASPICDSPPPVPCATFSPRFRNGVCGIRIVRSFCSLTITLCINKMRFATRRYDFRWQNRPSMALTLQIDVTRTPR